MFVAVTVTVYSEYSRDNIKKESTMKVTVSSLEAINGLVTGYVIQLSCSRRPSQKVQ